MRDFNTSRKIEEELREERKRFQDVAENAGEWVWEVDAGGRYTYSSPAVMKILGYKPEEVLGKHFSDFFHPEDRKGLKKTAEEIFSQRKPFREFLNRVVHRDGSDVWLSTSGVPLLDDNGNLLGYRGTDRDITERLRIERELRIKDKAIAHSLNGILLADLEGIIVYANPALLKMWGYDDDEVVGRASAEFLLKPKEAGKIIRHLHKKGEWKGELTAKKKDGTVITILLSASMVREENREPICLMGSFTDITDKKRIQEELRAEKEFVEEMLDSMPDGLVVFDPATGKLIRWNNAANRITGYNDEELACLINPRDCHPPEEHEKIFETMKRHEKEGRISIELTALTKDRGRVPVEVHATAFKDPEGKPKYIISVAHDITERKKLEEKLKKYRKHLEDMVEERTAELVKMNEKNLREIAKRKKSEKKLRISRAALQKQTKELESKNIALREILHQLDIEKKKIQDDVMTNIENLVFPVLKKIKMEAPAREEKLISVLEYNLGELASSFGRKISDARIHLTPREIEVCDLIKTGLTSKEIARLLRITLKTVEKHRDTIRKKFKISNKNINLTSFLQSL